ncbi:hypothetical protein JDV02_002011 [Purpureocillium takamizusanense]|uniref:IDI-2 n=1 Tax=Purpureocillium takamizusanense TaxID=2060973 RepID=A0A9Q8QAQ4_9HYPO|nr:uncharacterized protein JDV02_002011 [Purpureocillium takamizusanense]UNI15481.1 hypothetical protein JDV02_002011 [Purpureocillium takamizusanense]
MKLSTIFLLLSPLGLSAASSPTDHSCGKLGVMTVDRSKLPLNVDPNNIRECADHPEGGSKASRRDPEAAAECWFGKPSGCSSGYCFKTCGNGGEWCWTASNGGYGDWITCKSDSACSTDQACGQGDNCSACGCRC